VSTDSAPLPVYRSYLYVPGNDPRRIEKAYATVADVVVLDLEDAVPADQKSAARATVAAVLADGPLTPTYVRVNAVGTRWAQADVDAVAGPALVGVRVPKCERTEEVAQVAAWLAAAGCRAGVHCLLESALGVEAAVALATAAAAVAGISLGEADLRADLRAVGEEALLYARSRCVSAARAAGLPGPVQSVYTDVRDEAGLRRTTRAGRDLGFLGRSAIHPAQLEVIHQVVMPEPAEVAAARALLDAFAATTQAGSGVALADGRFVDEAVLRFARWTLALAEGGTR